MNNYYNLNGVIVGEGEQHLSWAIANFQLSELATKVDSLHACIGSHGKWCVGKEYELMILDPFVSVGKWEHRGSAWQDKRSRQAVARPLFPWERFVVLDCAHAFLWGRWLLFVQGNKWLAVDRNCAKGF